MNLTPDPRKTSTSAENQKSHRQNRQFLKRPSLPFMVVLAMIGAVIATGLTIGNRRPKSGGIASSDQQHKRGARVGEPRQSSRPKPSAVDPAILKSTGVGNSAGSENKFDSSSFVKPQTPTTTVARSSSLPKVVEMTIGEGGEQSSENSPLLRANGIPYSSATAGERDRDRDRERGRERGRYQEQDAGRVQRGEVVATSQTQDHTVDRQPREERLVKAHDFKGDLRRLPRTRPPQRERRELEPPDMNPRFYIPPGGAAPQAQTPEQGPSINPQANPPAPPPLNVYEGLDRFNWGAGSPPDTNGDVGKDHFIQTVNTSIGIFRKSDGFEEAAFTFNTFMSQGNFGNLCDTNNFGDPVVLYDTFEDRWIITDFAFLLDGSNNVVGPAYQCIAASQSGDPLAGGWNFYSRQISDNLNDYPKFGIWPDGLYMSANMFSFGAGAAFQGARVWAFNKAQMYAGRPIVNVVSFNVPGSDFTVVPSNARLQTGTPPVGRPNLFIGTWLFLNAVTVYKFHVDWNNIASSTFTGPDAPLAATSWPNAAVGNAGQPGTATLLDALQIRAMVQNQYTNFGGTESLWVPHTVRRANTSGVAAPRWYQVNVTGGTVAANLTQGTTWDPDGANITNRFMPSLALDRAGNLAMGYSVSSAVNEPLSTTPATNCTTCLNIFPSIRYAGRLAGDPVNTFSQTEQTFFTGTASQTGSTRWGDYSTMTLDPDGCTFWITNEYANPADQTFNHRWLTKFGNITAFPGCTPVGAGGTVSGTVTVNPGGAPISGATVNLGARSTTTDGSGNYSFTSIPAGTYPSMNASKDGFNSASASSIVVTDGGTTTQDFSLPDAPDSSCITDTTESDFLAGNPTSTLELTTSPGDVILATPLTLDQQNTAGTTTGTGIAATGATPWGGQTFIPTVTGSLAKVDVQLFSTATGTTPNLTVSVRATSAGLPTGPDLASATIPGFNNGAGVYYTATFGAPATLTSGTQYALLVRPVSNPSVGGYFWIRSSPSTYANGQRVLSTDSGVTWSADSTRDFNFKTYMSTGFTASGNLISSTKDSNPTTGFTPIWSTLSWNGSTPANTSLQFQVAGSNNVNGPFNFVGPDGTAGTFFTTSPVQLEPQFYNFRYLEYKAYLATTDSTMTPTLNDVTLCFNDVDCSSTSATITPTPSTVCENSTGNTASGPAGMTSYAWGITNGTITSATNTQSITYTAGASGTVTLSLTVTAPNGCIVSGSQPVTIDVVPTPTITPGGPTTVTYPATVTLNSSAASGNQWYVGGSPIGGATNQSYIVSGVANSGNYTVGVTDGFSCTSAQSSITTVIINQATPVVSATGGTFVYDGNPKAGSGSATGGAGENLSVTLSYTGTGATTYGPSATAPTLAGTYNVVAHTAGDANNNPGDSAPAALTINKATPTATATGGTFTYDGNPKAGSGSATGGGGESLSVTLSYTGAGATTYGPSATAPSLAGTYNVIVHTAGDANNNPGDSAPAALTINKFNPLMSAHGGTFTYNGSPRAGSGQAIGGAGESLPVTLTYQGISGTTYGPSATPPTNAGVYQVTAHTVGDANNNAADSLTDVLKINKATATITVTGYCVPFDGSAHTATGTATGVLSETLTGLVLTGTTHTTANAYLGDAWTFSNANYNDANGTVNDIITTKPTITPGGPTTFASGGSVTLNSSSATGNQWYLNGNPIGGATNSSFVANAAGNYTVIVTTSGCSSPASDPTTVTICPTSPVVTNGNDSGAGSLRQAILDVCDGGAITFQAGVSNVTLTSAALVIDKNLTITGPGANLLTVQRSSAGGTPQFRIFTINSGRTANISGLTVSNGNVGSTDGGGISNSGTLTLSACAVIGNSAGFSGGGVVNVGSSSTMTVSGCTISGNSANAAGSGIANGGTLTIINSTIAANTTDGLSNSGVGVATLVNDTFSGNLTRGLSNNSGATVNIRNTIVARNPAGGADVGGTFNSQGNNLIGNAPSGSGFTNGVNFDKAGTTAAPLDPLLAPLANYGGPNNTMALLPGSPALDAGTNSAIVNPPFSGPPFTDQRGTGFNRIVNSGTDIGAFESRGFTVAATSGSGQSTPFSTTFGSPLLATVSSAFSEPVTGGQLTFTAPGSGASATFTGGVTSLTLTINGSGQASASATANATVGGPYNVVAGASGALSTNFALTNIKANQTIAVNTHAPSSAAFNSTFTVAATASSTLGVTYSSAGSCSNSGATFTINSSTGTCTVKYDQGGNSNFNAATQVIETVNSQKANQTITFNALGNKNFGDADFTVSGTASSNLALSFTASGNCTISTNSVHLTGAGSCTITAKQGGDTNFNAAADVPRAFTINQAASTAAVSSSANPSNLTQNVTFTATVTGPAGTGTPTGTVTFKDGAATITCSNAGGQTLNASGVATCQTSTLTAGTHTITAFYSGDTNFATSTGTLSPNQFVNNLPLVSFSAANYSVNESDGVVHVIVNRTGDTTVPFNVDYATSDTGASPNCALLNTGLASSMCDYDTVLGTLKFAANQTQATIDVTINQDNRTEGPETFTVNLSNATGGALLVNPATATVTISDTIAIFAPGVPAPNAIDDTATFVRQQYHDFLNREPDAAGLAFWVQNIDKCNDPAQRAPGQTLAQCIQTQRVITSAAFFLSIEFMQTGTFVRSFYVAALDRPATNNMATFIEWLRDTQGVQRGVIVNQGNWQATLDANRLAFMQDFVMRPEFVGLYPTTDTPTQYINKLYNHALGRTPTTTELNDALSVFGGAGTATNPTARGQALLKVTQASDFISREIPRAFVQFEFFGYLRRNPNDPPDGNFNGYNFWLNKLNQFGGDFVKAEMVKAFIESPEYRQRFAP